MLTTKNGFSIINKHLAKDESLTKLHLLRVALTSFLGQSAVRALRRSTQEAEEAPLLRV